jgi:tetratricopeptide (TPR) repeat protein
VLVTEACDAGVVLERLRAAWRTDPVDDAALAAALKDALRVAPTGNRASGVSELPPVAELAGDLADVYERLGRTDEAVAAMREAIAAGWDGVPDGRCRIAEILTAGGRLTEAAAVWEEVAAEFPDDVWVHNNAGIEYARVGEHQTALGYLSRGLELALEGGDPERLVDQLAHFRAGTLTALGREPDVLQARAASFLADPPPRSRSLTRQQPTVGAADDPAAHAGSLEGRMALALAWFPPDEFRVAAARWPELLESWGVSDYSGYCAALEAHLAGLAETTGLRPRLAPVIVETYLAWCAEAGRDPAERDSRASYSAELGRTDRVRPWPPGRNEPCWCRSGRKYKHCCRAAARDRR